MIRLAFSAKLDHLYRLTDNTGIRARVRPSDPNAGYFLEQNALALIVAVRALGLTRESGLLDYVRHYMAFVEQAQRPDGSFRAYLSPAGRWDDAEAPEEARGAAIWALGFAAKHSAQTEVRLRALRCLDRTLSWVGRLSAPRAQACALLGLQQWREAEPAPVLEEVAAGFASRLASAYDAASPDWPWFEPRITPSSARLPHALLGTSHRGAAVESLAWLCRRVERAGRFMGVALPAEAAALGSACLAAYQAGGESRFRRWAELAYDWFLGKNAAGVSLIDPETGGCSDAPGPAGAVPSQGADALLAWLTAAQEMADAGV